MQTVATTVGAEGQRASPDRTGDRPAQTCLGFRCTTGGATLDARSVIDFWTAAQAAGLNPCLDGGWAVDAVLGRQTRPHGDLDIALPADQEPALRRLLAALGFVDVETPDQWEHNFVMQDVAGRAIDVHTYVLDANGANAGGVPYTAEHLQGTGTILGTTVRCVPPVWLVTFHTGYDVDEVDWQDVRLLCEEFCIAIPDCYRDFIGKT